MKKRVLFIDNTAHHLYGQLHNIKAAKKYGYDVVLLIPDDGVYYRKLQALGYYCVDYIASWKGQNPLAEFFILVKLRGVFKRLKPDVICTFTIKPNLYTAIINKRSHIKQIANITGLGYGFMNSKLKALLFAKLYRFAVGGIDHIFFQNKDDYNYLTNMNVFERTDNIDILPGSGVNLDDFPYVGINKDHGGEIKFLYSGRILGDKGIYELITAFTKLKEKVPNVKLTLIGNYFPANPSAINSSQINEWVATNIINYAGMVDNVPEMIANSDCIVLPSYREGMPRSLLEASSMGKPIITVNSIGCKDVIDDGITGFMAHVKDAESLYDAMYNFTQLSYDDRMKMGYMGRKKMEKEFDQNIVVNKYIETINSLL